MSQKNWKELLMKYKGYLLIIVILLVLVITLVRGCGSDKGNENEEQPGVEVVDSGTEEEENTLEENTHASVERLLTKFLDCMMTGDVEALEPITDFLSDENKEKIISRSRMYDSYDNLKIFTKDGPEEDSYIAYLCFDIKFVEIVGAETLLPDVLCLYVSPKDADGNRYIRYDNVEEDEELQAYVRELEEDPEVKALYDDVKARYTAALESDEKLNKFYMEITGQVAEEEEPAEEPAEENTEESTEENTEEASEESAQEEPAGAEVQNRETRVTESVNVRAQASTESERLALAYQGDPITQIESYEDGWSKVEYKGLTGYVKTEFLE